MTSSLQVDNYPREFCKQHIQELSLAYRFRKMVFIGKNLKHVETAPSFDLLFIKSGRSFLFKFAFSWNEILCINT